MALGDRIRLASNEAALRGQENCVIAFNTPYSAPACTANDETTGTLVRAVATTSHLTLSGSMTAADKITYICIGI